MILDKLAKSTRKRVEEKKKIKSYKEIEREAMSLSINQDKSFYEAIRKDGISFICEIKQASPSKGIIAENFPYMDIAIEYEAVGASAISVLTEPEYFKGKDEYLLQISEKVKIPTLRKDFTVDPYQIYEAKLLGASAILLICSLLTLEELKSYNKITKELGLSALIEAHDEEEVKKAIECGGDIIGVNNRNLKDFTVDLTNSIRLRELVPKDILFVSESGIQTPEDIQRLQANNVDAVLIGETFMRSENKKEMIRKLRGDEI